MREVFDEALETNIELFNRRDPLYGKTCAHVAQENNLDNELAVMIQKGVGRHELKTSFNLRIVGTYH